jgi:hypothetical protein
MNTNQDGPAVPINGDIPTDGEYRIIGPGRDVVEQWSEWAGMWDTAFHASCSEDAERFVREHTEQVIRTYFIAGLRRQVGAIGAFEPFLASEAGTSVEDARNKLVESFNLGGYDTVQIRCIAPPDPPIDPLTDEAFRFAVAANTALLRRTGVPADVVKVALGYKPPVVSVNSLHWVSFNDHGLRLPSLRLVEEWTTGYRYVWTDDKRLVVTFCEGDVSGELFFSPEAFADAWARATEFYANH